MLMIIMMMMAVTLFCYEVSPLKAKGTLYWTGCCLVGSGRQFSTGEDGLVKEPWPDVWAD